MDEDGGHFEDGGSEADADPAVHEEDENEPGEASAVRASFLPAKKLYSDSKSLAGDPHRGTREYMRVFSRTDSKTHPLEGFCRESGVARDDDGKKWFFLNIHVTFACFAWESISTGHAWRSNTSSW